MTATARNSKTAQLTARAIKDASGDREPIVAVRLDGVRRTGFVTVVDNTTRFVALDGTADVLELGGNAKRVEVELNDDGTLYYATMENEVALAARREREDEQSRVDYMRKKLGYAEKDLASARAGLASAAATDSASNLAGNLNSLAEAEGKVYVLRRFFGVLEAHPELAPKELAAEIALEVLGSGPDDSWSGRRNDVARARFDGVRSAANDLRLLF